MMPLVTVHDRRSAADHSASGVSPHKAMSVMPDISLRCGGGMPSASRISRASSTAANGRLLRSGTGNHIHHECIYPFHRVGKPFHALAECDDRPVCGMRHGAQLGGAHLGVAADGAEPSVEEAAVVERRQAPGFVLREHSAGPVNIIEVVFDSDLGNRELRREPGGRRQSARFFLGTEAAQENVISVREKKRSGTRPPDIFRFAPVERPCGSHGAHMIHPKERRMARRRLAVPSDQSRRAKRHHGAGGNVQAQIAKAARP